MSNQSVQSSELQKIQKRLLIQALFSVTFADSLRPILLKHFGNEGAIIEFRSGLGYLNKLLPEYATRLQQTDVDSAKGRIGFLPAAIY